MHHRPFQQVDVFTATAYRGNPLAVVLDGTDLSTEEMQQFTRWTNLSEATFVLPPTPEGRAAGADYRVRIFYPAGELPFAGHPTLGTCHAWLKAGGQPQVAGRIDQAPAGGDILGVLFTVFIVLLVTDILGLTKVFPFTRSVR